MIKKKNHERISRNRDNKKNQIRKRRNVVKTLTIQSAMLNSSASLQCNCCSHDCGRTEAEHSAFNKRVLIEPFHMRV